MESPGRRTDRAVAAMVMILAAALVVALAAMLAVAPPAVALADAEAEGERIRPRRLRCGQAGRWEEHTSELQSLMRIPYAVLCLKKNTHNHTYLATTQHRT